jgi:hypothetical protein
MILSSTIHFLRAKGRRRRGTAGRWNFSQSFQEPLPGASLPTLSEKVSSLNLATTFRISQASFGMNLEPPSASLRRRYPERGRCLSEIGSMSLTTTEAPFIKAGTAAKALFIEQPYRLCSD